MASNATMHPHTINATACVTQARDALPCQCQPPYTVTYPALPTGTAIAKAVANGNSSWPASALAQTCQLRCFAELVPGVLFVDEVHMLDMGLEKVQLTPAVTERSQKFDSLANHAVNKLVRNHRDSGRMLAEGTELADVVLETAFSTTTSASSVPSASMRPAVAMIAHQLCGAPLHALPAMYIPSPGLIAQDGTRPSCPEQQTRALLCAAT